MKLKALQENLNEALSIASRFTNVKAQLPILANLHFQAKKNKLVISSTNLELSVSVSIGAKVASDGEIAIPSKVISDIVSNLPKEPLDISSEKERVKVKGSGFKADISGMNTSDFPSIPKNVGKGSIEISKAKFTESLSKVLYSVSSDETRPVLTGVLMIFSHPKTYLVSTDGFRLSLKKLKVGSKIKKQSVILPKSALSEIARLPGNEDTVKLSFKKDDNQVVFGLGNVVLTSRIIEGVFPDYEKIIPKESTYRVNVDKEELLRAVKLSGVFARESANMIKFIVKKDSVGIEAESSKSGSQKTQIDAKVDTDRFGGRDSEFSIAFNYRFLEEFLNTVEGEDVYIELTEPNAPGVFTDPADPDYLHLIMPVRLQS